MTFIPQKEVPKSAFGDTRITELAPIVQGTFEYTVDNAELNTNTIGGSATITQGSGMGTLATTTTTGSSALLQSKQHAKYRAGLGGLLRFTAIFNGGSSAATQSLAGLADETGSTATFKNGYMIGWEGTTFGVHRYQNDTLTSVALASCDDPLDGTGISGMTLDETKLNVYAIQFQYLGAGRINFLVEDDATGDFVIFHSILYANLHTSPSVYNPNFNFTAFVDNGATTDALDLSTASYAYFVEGYSGQKEIHRPQQGTGIVTRASVTTEVPIFTIRNKTTYASKTNFIDILLESWGVNSSASGTTNTTEVILIFNGSLTGASYSDIESNNSVVDIDTAASAVSGGKRFLPVFLAGKEAADGGDLFKYDIILHPGDTCTVAAASSSTATIKASLLWKELF